MANSLLYSVGFEGVNDKRDVRTVQQWLNRAGASPGLITDGLCGSNTIAAIRDFQSRFMQVPDGRVDPNGRTMRELLDSPSEPLPKPKTETIKPPDILSYWQGDSSRWSHEKKLESLNDEFRPKVIRVIDHLAQNGFKPKIYYAWRSVQVQAELFKKGNSKVRFSFHNAQFPDGRPNAYAVDIIDKRWAWEAAAAQNGFWGALGKFSEELGLVWGGSWQFKDYAHIQGLDNQQLGRIKRESGLA